MSARILDLEVKGQLGFLPTSSHYSGMFPAEVYMLSICQINVAVFCLVGTCALAQEGIRPTTPAAKMQEDAVIAANRKQAKPRSIEKGRPLSAVEQERARVFRAAKKAVVYINASTNNSLIDRSTGQVYEIPAGTGTGFVWDNLGHVVTNYHVIKMDVPGPDSAQYLENIEVTLSDHRTYKARLIGRSLANDIAVLHVFAPLKDLTPLPLGSSKNLVAGQSVLAIGNPFGLDHSLSSGVVSALGRSIPSSFSMIKDVIQTDAAINPGNSGGPLLDMSGRLIGMNTAIPAVTGANIGIGFAIPADTLNKVVPMLIASGQMDRPSLGLMFVAPLPAFHMLGIREGIAIYTVTPDSPAARAGLRGLSGPEEKPVLGDVIMTFQGKPVNSEIDLADRLDLLPPETPLDFEILRGDKTITVTLRPWEQAPEVKVTVPV